MLRIFKGDDTDFADANRLRITIGTTVVLAGCHAEFSFLGVTRQIPDASTGTFEVAFTAAETAVMPLGVHCATIRVFDAQGRQRTTTNTLRIEVTDNVDMAYSGENAADVDGHLVVKGVVDDGYGVPADLPEGYTPDEMRTFLNRLAALLRNSMLVAATLLMLAFAPAMGAEVEYARFGSMKATASVVTNVDLSAKADATNVYTKTEINQKLDGYATLHEVDSGLTDAENDAVSRANGYTDSAIQSLPAWSKAETPPQTMTTNAVHEIVTNEVAVGVGDWRTSSYYGGDWRVLGQWMPSVGTWQISFTNVYTSAVTDDIVVTGDENASALNVEVEGGAVPIVRDAEIRNSLNLARLADLPPLTNGLARTSDIPTTAEDVGAYSAASGSALEGTVSVWEAYWSGTNVVFEVTNYYGNTSGELPRLRVRELRDGTWHVVWDEVDKFRVCESNLLRSVSASNATMRTELAEDFAPKAWGTVTDKGTPNFVDNSVWMTSPETYFAGGTEYQRVAVGDGAICVLVDRGAPAHTTGEPGTFRFQDDGGTNYFGFAKSDSYTIGCRTDGITVEGSLVTLRYDVIMGGTDVPITYWTTNLSSGVWTQLNNADGTAAEGAPYTVTWYTSGGSYYAAINCGMNPQGFFKAETSVAGDVVFETNMKARLGGGIECTNTQTGVMGVIRPSYNGSSVGWTWSAR